MKAKGGRTNPRGERIQFTKAASDELGQSFVTIQEGSMSLPLVNSERQTIDLLLGSAEHVCNMDRLGRAQSLVAVGADGWIDGTRAPARLGDVDCADQARR